MTSFLYFRKPSLKVSYHESRTFREWKAIFQTDWKALLILYEFIKWLILVSDYLRHKSNVKIGYRA